MLALLLAGVWAAGSLAIGAHSVVTALRGRRERRKLRTSGGSAAVRQSHAVSKAAPAPAFGHAGSLAAVLRMPGAIAVDRELDLLAVRLNPLYYGERHLLRAQHPGGDDRRFTSYPDHDDHRWSREK